MNVKDMPISDRPRERLLNIGANSLTNQELLAIILKTGNKEKSVMDLSYEILNSIGQIDNFKDLTVNKLMKIKGIGLVKAISLIATIELGKRIFFKNSKVNPKLHNAKEIYDYMRYLILDKKQEHFYCLYFNNKQELIERKLLFMGTINKSVVHPREIFKHAYLLSASSIICIHNHPSGDATPSHEDILFTKNLIKLGELNKIPITDHIIVTDNTYYSFFDNNILN